MTNETTRGALDAPGRVKAAAAGLATTIIPGPGEDGYALTDEESAAEALAEQDPA